MRIETWHVFAAVFGLMAVAGLLFRHRLPSASSGPAEVESSDESPSNAPPMQKSVFFKTDY